MFYLAESQAREEEIRSSSFWMKKWILNLLFILYYVIVYCTFQMEARNSTEKNQVYLCFYFCVLFFSYNNANQFMVFHKCMKLVAVEFRVLYCNNIYNDSWLSFLMSNALRRNTNWDSTHEYSEFDIKRVLEYLNGNIFVIFGDEVSKQFVGSPISTNSAP